MKCLIYLRVSTKEQAKKRGAYSIPTQSEACLKLIKIRVRILLMNNPITVMVRTKNSWRREGDLNPRTLAG